MDWLQTFLLVSACAILIYHLLRTLVRINVRTSTAPKLIQDIIGNITTVEANLVELGQPESIQIATTPSKVKVTFAWKYDGVEEPAYFHIRNALGMLQVAKVDFGGTWLNNSSMVLKWDWEGSFGSSASKTVTVKPNES